VQVRQGPVAAGERRILTVVALGALVVPAAASPALRLGGVEVRPAGYVQGDTRVFPGWDAEPGQRSDGFDVRHLRGGARLKSARISGQIIVDVAGFANRAMGDDVAPLFVLRQRLKDAYLDAVVRQGLVVRAGHFKVPVSREFLVPEQRTDFIERATFSIGMAPGRDWGVMAHGRLGVARGLGYMLGAFAGDNWAEASRARNTVAGRLVLEAVPGVHLAVSATRGDVEGPGLQGKSASGWVFCRRPATQGQRRRLGADVLYIAGPVALTAELLQSREERHRARPAEDLAPVVGVGWSTAARWRLRGPRPTAEPAWRGASLDVALRFDSLRFDDPEGGASSSHAVAASVSYEPRSWIRLLANGVVDRYGEGARVPAGRERSYLTLLGRLQLVIP